MKVKLLSCWFTTSYGTYTDGLRRALERALGNDVGIIASNCGCGDPMEVNRKFVNDRCAFVEFPNVPYYRKSNAAKEWLMVQARQLVYNERARRYLKLAGEAELLHFQQILNAFGSVTVFNWLDKPCAAARVVTVHELDPYQLQHPELAVRYNKSDGLIVHTAEMRDKLIALGVDGGRVDVVEHGIDLVPLYDGPRAGLLFYAGHKLNANKGLDTLFAALAVLKKKLGPRCPVLSIHSHMGAGTPEAGLQSAREAGVDSHVRWLNEISFEKAVAEYQRALLCVLPYTGSFAGYPATLAMANGAPVVGTREAGLPEHLGDTGVWIEPRDPAALAAAILRLLDDEPERRRIAGRARARAEQELSWDAIARKTLAVYTRALAHKRTGRDAALRA